MRFSSQSCRSDQFARGGSLRPPWSRESTVLDQCISCGDCIAACPESILQPGPGKTPVVNFAKGPCTFCKQCADACGHDVFNTAQAPWKISADITADCLLNKSVACRACTDTCDTRALRFKLQAGTVGSISIDASQCTGCGACASVCPVDAIAFSLRHDDEVSVR